MIRGLRKLLVLKLCLLTLLFGVATLPDITMTGSAIQLASSGTAWWVQVKANASNTGVIRVGDANVSATRGADLAAGAAFLFPYRGDPYALSGLYVFGSASDKVSVLIGN